MKLSVFKKITSMVLLLEAGTCLAAPQNNQIVSLGDMAISLDKSIQANVNVTNNGTSIVLAVKPFIINIGSKSKKIEKLTDLVGQYGVCDVEREKDRIANLLAEGKGVIVGENTGFYAYDYTTIEDQYGVRIFLDNREILDYANKSCYYLSISIQNAVENQNVITQSPAYKNLASRLDIAMKSLLQTENN